MNAQPETATVVHTLPQPASELLATAAHHGWSGTVGSVTTRLPGERDARPHLIVQVRDGAGRVLSQEYAPHVLTRAAVVSSTVPGNERCYTPTSETSQLEYIALHPVQQG